MHVLFCSLGGHGREHLVSESGRTRILHHCDVDGNGGRFVKEGIIGIPPNV